MLPLFDQGRLSPVIDSRFPLSAIAEAQTLMESNATTGKILIDVCD
jgi:NADPH:quinone reductase-like Zn-dependent oxidoreductase